MDIKRLHKKSKEKQLKILFQRYGKQLFSYGKNNWKMQEDAAWELSYKVLYKMVAVLPDYTFDSEQKLSSFLFRMYINFLKNNIRDEKLKRQGTQEVELNEALVFAEDEKVVVKNEKLNHLKVLLDELEDWKRILLLMRAQNFSYAQISEYTGQSEKNLKVYYGRLKKQLEKKLEYELNKVESHG